jgi:hypothetical protein
MYRAQRIDIEFAAALVAILTVQFVAILTLAYYVGMA